MILYVPTYTYLWNRSFHSLKKAYSACYDIAISKWFILILLWWSSETPCHNSRFFSFIHLSWLLIQRIILFIYHTIYINYILGCCYITRLMCGTVYLMKGRYDVPLNVTKKETAMRQYFIIIFFFLYFLEILHFFFHKDFYEHFTCITSVRWLLVSL